MLPSTPQRKMYKAHAQPVLIIFSENTPHTHTHTHTLLHSCLHSLTHTHTHARAPFLLQRFPPPFILDAGWST